MTGLIYYTEVQFQDIMIQAMTVSDSCMKYSNSVTINKDNVQLYRFHDAMHKFAFVTGGCILGGKYTRTIVLMCTKLLMYKQKSSRPSQHGE